MTVTEIALTCGFSSLSYFTASFTLCSQRFYEKIFNDYSYRDIAKELQVNPKIIKDYFISEGLIKG
ncbi:AraC-like DNA-binding protein [Bacillus capparidis]|uniref:AraC-like DNA-binding protein n=2 Tax=Bacillus TaxID=1386 RepID=A0ABS4CXI0_9BACI|nr:AraC-like DNA-binding protein [Bacillus capparidis]